MDFNFDGRVDLLITTETLDESVQSNLIYLQKHDGSFGSTDDLEDMKISHVKGECSVLDLNGNHQSEILCFDNKTQTRLAYRYDLQMKAMNSIKFSRFSSTKSN